MQKFKMFGLKEADILTIQETFEMYPQITKAYIFGSRAKGNYKNGSDIDIAIKGENISFDIVIQIAGHLNEETLMPYHFDVLDYHSIQNDDLIKHIDRQGILFYEHS
jgi:predicted nucleotidyltransferase